MTDEEAATASAQMKLLFYVVANNDFFSRADRDVKLTAIRAAIKALDDVALGKERAALVAISQAVVARFHERGQCPLCDGTLAHTETCPITQYRNVTDR